MDHSLTFLRPQDPARPAAAAANAFDLETSLDRLGGDLDILLEVAEAFCATAPELLEQITAAAGQRDGPGLKRTAHSLKGSAANFGAVATCEAAQQLERMGGAGSFDGVDGLVQLVERETFRLQGELEAFMRASGH